jgi:hypothetical protein
MFIKYIKEISLKKKLKKSLLNVRYSTQTTPIQTIGILIDESYFNEKEELIQELIGFGIKEENIKMLVFRDKIKKNDVFSQPTFSAKDVKRICKFPV